MANRMLLCLRVDIVEIQFRDLHAAVPHDALQIIDRSLAALEIVDCEPVAQIMEAEGNLILPPLIPSVCPPAGAGKDAGRVLEAHGQGIG